LPRIPKGESLGLSLLTYKFDPDELFFVDISMFVTPLANLPMKLPTFPLYEDLALFRAAFSSDF
jgi:hypothetical protein